MSLASLLAPEGQTASAIIRVENFCYDVGSEPKVRARVRKETRIAASKYRRTLKDLLNQKSDVSDLQCLFEECSPELVKFSVVSGWTWHNTVFFAGMGATLAALRPPVEPVYVIAGLAVSAYAFVAKTTPVYRAVETLDGLLDHARKADDETWKKAITLIGYNKELLSEPDWYLK